MPEALFISIITPSLNRVGFVAEAVESVLRQNSSSFEHIIVDGGSTDGTLDVLKHYPHLKVVSQPDDGIYDALNKGIHLAQGEVIGFLNTDDLYERDIFDTVAQTFADHSEIDALVGGATILHENSRGDWVPLATFPSVSQDELLMRATQGAPIFNAWFFRKRLFEEIGMFDTNYLYVADRDFLIRMAFRLRPYASLDRLVYHYRMHPGSFTLSGQDSGEAAYMFESRALAERYIQMQGIRAADLKCFKTWHSQITAEQIVTAWRKKAIGRMFQFMRVGFRYNTLGWPGIFLGKTQERLSVLINRIFCQTSV
jgi:glycosyltransferase involved in cell wall biosynthesis